MRPLERTQPKLMHKVTIDKIIPNAQTPRVEKIKSNPNNREQIRNCIASKTMAHLHAILTSDDPHEPRKEHRQSMMKRRTHTSSIDNSCNIQNTKKYCPNHPQRIWEISQWISRWENREANQNNSFHQKRRCSSGQKERCDVQKL